MTALAIALVIIGGIAGAAQAAVMGRFGERVGTLEALAFATMLTAILAGALTAAGCSTYSRRPYIPAF